MTLCVAYSPPFSPHRPAITLDIPAQGVTGVYGPSGIGKTTLLRFIAGLGPIKRGKLRFCGDVWFDDGEHVPSQQRGVAYVFQQSNLFLHMSVKDNVFFVEKLKANQRQRCPVSNAVDQYMQKNLSSLVDLFALEPLYDRHPSSLSGGEQQRVALVRGLLSSPRLLLLDEPLSACDQPLKHAFLDFLDGLVESTHLPVVYVSHSKSELSHVAQHLVVFDNNGHVSLGDCQQILSDVTQSIVFDGEIVSNYTGTLGHDHHGADTHLVHCDIGELLVYSTHPHVDAVNAIKQHANISVQIKAKDVSIALSRAIDSSISNILSGRIAAVEAVDAHAVLIKLSIGNGYLFSLISNRSYRALSLSVGQAVYAQIKAVAID